MQNLVTHSEPQTIDSWGKLRCVEGEFIIKSTLHSLTSDNGFLD